MSGDERNASTAPASVPAFSAFERALHSPFIVAPADGGSVTLTLMEVSAGASRPGWESFSLIFAGPSPPAFWDGLFEIEHAEIGSFSVFLVAVQTDGDSQQYQALFNRPST
jgi:hypothetical protein